MFNFATIGRKGTWSFTADGGDAGTPQLSTDDSGPVLRAEVTFNARGGFYYKIQAYNATPFYAIDGLLPTGGVVVAPGWQSVTRSAFFVPQNDPVTLFVSFTKGDTSGKGTLSNFILSCELLQPLSPTHQGQMEQPLQPLRP